MRYGEIYWAKPDPGVGSEQTGRRPVLVISSDDALDVIPNVVTTVPLTTRERGWATRIRITGDSTGLAASTWAICEQVRTISTDRLDGRLGTAGTTTLRDVSHVLRYLLNL